MIYLHIPFCKGKCIYCDFYSGKKTDTDRYIKAAIREFEHRKDELLGCSLSSFYIGGGTPSLLEPGELAQLVNGIRDLFPKADIVPAEDMEFTIEVNPEDVSPEKIKAWKELGINRVSMGVQSLDDSELTFLHRRHNARKAVEALTLLKDNISNVSVDIIFATPNQTVGSLTSSVEKIVELAPQHISAYSLTYEPHTALSLLRERGSIRECDEDTAVRLGRTVDEILSEAGYCRYEISNWAKPGFHSRHNTGYWNGLPYLGLGPSAASFDGDACRRTNPADLKNYVDFWEKISQVSPFYVEERLDLQARQDEMLFLTLRTADGLDLNAFAAEFGERAAQRLVKAAERWVSSGKMKSDGSRLCMARDGFEISDFIILDLSATTDH
ncbi:MAG: radical SAM family heme chaperone HemW [Muribaculaceae bacterium]|nr:radical SAM family heme chaperone HemW [Muribaculaceae bacterium]